MPFAYQAIDASGRVVSDVIQAANSDEAARTLRSRGLLITRLAETSDARTASEETPALRLRQLVNRLLRREDRIRVRWKELVFFTQQMAMLLGSGARMVPALAAIESQASGFGFRRVVRQLRDRVEDGVPISAAMCEYPAVFNAVFTSLVAAGEASGRMPEMFDRLAVYTRQQQEVRQKILGAMVYPALLICMSMGILAAMFGFVLPRFTELFTTLGAELPWSTKVLIRISDGVRGHWFVTLVALLSAAGGMAVALTSETFRTWWAGVYTRIPIAGRVIRRIILARVFRILGLLVDNSVQLLDAIRLVKGITRSTAFRQLIDAVEQAVSDGRLIASALQDSPLVPATMTAAVATGEESGRLGQALLFIADSLDVENAQLLASLSRIIEPLILIGMGAVVGVVAVSLFMPLFDIATIAGG